MEICGNEKKKVILISFLNAVLGLEGQNRVKDVALLNPFQLPRIAGEKSSIIDVKATDEKGSTFIVEMQVAEPKVMPDNVDDEGLKEAYEEAAQHNWTREEYDAYIYAGIREQDERGRIQKEKENQRDEYILAMNDKGISLGIIAEITKLGEDEIKQIIQNQSNK